MSAAFPRPRIGSRVGESVKDGGVYSSFSEKGGVLEGRSGDAHNVFGESSSSSGTMVFSDGRDDSNQLSGSSDCEEMEEENKANVLNDDLSETTTCNSIEELEEESSEESDQDEAAMSPERPPLVEDVRGCATGAAGKSEGRKCTSCIGHRIHEPKRGSLGKSSRMMKKMLTHDAVKQIMSAELSCPVNQLPPHLIYVNDKPLSMEELVTLQSCSNPPRSLDLGDIGTTRCLDFGKGRRAAMPDISPLLQTGYQIRRDVSNGATNVLINGREITNRELWLLWAAGIRSEGLILLGEDSIRDSENVAKRIERSMMYKLLLVGCDQSGTSTIFKQAKILYNVPFSEDEKQNIKDMIQRNLYRYISILLEGREHFREEDAMDLRRRRADKLVLQVYIYVVREESDHVDEKNAYSFSRNLENFSSWLQQITMTGNLEVIFPAATREYSPLVEELWKDKAFQAIFKRRNELPMLPRVANYFLDRAVEISRMDYEPSELDILYADGVTSSNGVASMEFSLPKSSQDGYMESLDHNEPPLSCELIRVHANSLGENCKWLEMFEDSDLFLFCISLTEYAEYHEDINGTRSNKLLETKRLFERIITHPTLADKQFLLILNKFDLLDEIIYETPCRARLPLCWCEVQEAVLFPDGRKLFVVQATGLEADSVDKALRYGKEILKWEDERHTVSMNQDSSESFDPSSSAYTS
ncbi:hypothetical protein SASPL_128789 [Salvia splendens]|uniref:Guanine nucleotide-binding protein subunit alpha, other n=1 Tax=Salvia splendens TaxID=180675 RepID=A0A8X8XC74_SALSN|nr:hypothetical protein SASPL_128789 [Salvia splendens]